MPQLYPELEPYRSGTLPVDALHTLYWEESGHPHGAPVLFLHGGPGSGTTPRQRQFFDPAHYRIVLFDQRGAGKSTPLGETRDNTTAQLVADIERLRELLGIERWLIFGGSWGSTLALAYGQAHPECCLGFVLRGIFLCTQAEIDWFMHGMGWFFPQAHTDFTAAIPCEERSELLAAYCRRLFDASHEQGLAAARAWSRYEGQCLHLLPNPAALEAVEAPEVALGVGRLEAHYFRHQGFLTPDQLVHGIPRIEHLPAVIVQGRYDVICPPATAWRLHQAWPGSILRIIDAAGHSALEPGITSALVEATNQFRDHGRFDPFTSG